MARGCSEFSAENSQSVAGTSSCLKLRDRALCIAVCSVLTVDTQERALAHWSHHVAEVTSRVVRIELGDARACAPSRELETQGDSLASRSRTGLPKTCLTSVFAIRLGRRIPETKKVWVVLCDA